MSKRSRHLPQTDTEDSEGEISTPATPELLIPPSWQKGELLDQKKNPATGQFTLRPLRDAPPGQKWQPLEFSDAYACQNFIGWWYQRVNR